MALKKSELYSSLWSSCDELRGGMDASQYKDYVLVLLFIKYVSDKYAGVPYAPIEIPEGASFKDMVTLKGKPDIGDQINKKIIAPLANVNRQLSQADFPDFNDPVKLGDGKEKVDRLTNLIAIFENPALDFSKNRAEGDDILGDAYEYLMRHFATDSGKSKGQFYTPAEVSRVIAQILGIREAKTSNDTTIYDPTCGSGSLLLKVADEARTPVSLYGQDKDASTAGLARMNMILHNNPTAEIVQGNSITDPKFKDNLYALRPSASLRASAIVYFRGPAQYPIIDQGQYPMVGFSDKHEKRFRCPQDGVIVFGDHTCIVKFVDLDFLVGAEGTQVLLAKDGQCARFHAYQLEHKGISPTGYNRHFKFLKERSFVAPSLAEQTAIATILSDMDAEIAALEAELNKARNIKQGMLQELLTGKTRLI